jgi:hypothetical protein
MSRVDKSGERPNLCVRCCVLTGPEKTLFYRDFRPGVRQSDEKATPSCGCECVEVPACLKRLRRWLAHTPGQEERRYMALAFDVHGLTRFELKPVLEQLIGSGCDLDLTVDTV